MGGSQSTSLRLENMVFQGTVWGPMLWNIFYADAAVAIRSKDFTEIVFADDLNAFKRYEAKETNEVILGEMKMCQEELLAWGRASQVMFDAGKESRHILSRTQAYGDPFVLLGVCFDCKLLMSDSVYDLARNCRWRLKAILRAKWFNTSLRLTTLYKAQLLSS